eukprot:3941082-Rhodomonas_salina.1
MRCPVLTKRLCVPGAPASSCGAVHGSIPPPVLHTPYSIPRAHVLAQLKFTPKPAGSLPPSRRVFRPNADPSPPLSSAQQADLASIPEVREVRVAQSPQQPPFVQPDKPSPRQLATAEPEPVSAVTRAAIKSSSFWSVLGMVLRCLPRDPDEIRGAWDVGQSTRTSRQAAGIGLEFTQRAECVLSAALSISQPSRENTPNRSTLTPSRYVQRAPAAQTCPLAGHPGRAIRCVSAGHTDSVESR